MLDDIQMQLFQSVWSKQNSRHRVECQFFGS